MAKFESDMGRAVGLAERSARGIAESFAHAKEAIEGLAGAFAVEQVYEFGMKAIESAGRLEELHIQTGLSVEAISALSNEARLAGTDLESATSAFDKMQKLAFQAAGGNQQAARAFAAIGVSASQLAQGLKDPDQLLKLVSDKLTGFRDDGNKAALMMELFGKSGAQMNELLQAIATNGFNAATVTAEQAKQAKEAADAVMAWKIQWEEITQTVLGVALPLISKAIAGIKYLFAGFVTFMSNTWATLKMDAIVGWNAIVDVARNGASDLGALLAKSPFKTTQEWGKAISEWGSKSGVAIDQAVADWKDKLRENAAIMDQAAADYVASTTSKVEFAAAPKTKSIKPPAADDSLKGLKMALEERLKALQAAAKTEDSAMKLLNAQLDQDYATGVVGLADYANQKQAILAASLSASLAIFDQEETAVERYIKTLTSKNDIDAANAKLEQIRADRSKALLDSQAASVALTDKLVKEQQALAKSIIDVNVAYARVTGNTELATKLQTEQNDAMLKASLLANGLTEEYKKLLAVEEDARLRASKAGKDGVIRSLQDYAKAAQDLASQTESLTTSMFKGVEDNLVSLVSTGKTSFRDLANSIIADIARITIKQSITGPIASWLGTLIGAGIGGATASTSSGTGFFASAEYGGPHALGGSVTAGVGYMVGENGPEWFQPGSSGTIVPNDSLGGTVNVTTNIDARHATTDFAQQLPGILKRNNDQVKAELMYGMRRGKFPVTPVKA